MNDPPPNAGGDRRYHGLDALRAGAMALGVVLHAAAPYLRYPMKGLVWAVDGPPAGTATFPWADAVFWWLHAWRVPLFFVLAGFFAAMLTERRGARAFLEHRTKRVLLPLLGACVVILPLCYFAFAWGWTTTGLATWSDVFRISFGEGLKKDDVLGPAHLWFLIYLSLFCLLYAALSRFVPDGSSPWTQGWLAFLVLASMLIAGFDPAVALTFKNDFVPRPWEFLYQGLFFVAGAMLYGKRSLLDGWAKRCGSWVSLAWLAGGISVGMTLAMGSMAETFGHLGPAPGFGLAWAACGWLTILALLAVAVRWLAAPRPWLRWLSDSAYWVYLAHVPVVAAVHVALHHTPVPIAIRFALAIAVSLAATLWTYHAFIRYSSMGAWLHGRRERPEAAAR